MFGKLFAVIAYTVKEHIRNRIYLAVFVFGFVMVGGSLVVSSLAVDARLRVLIDLGLAGIEFIALLSIVFVTVNLILEEVESKSIYLILSHPIERWQYVLGRFLGTLISVTSGMVLMAILHVLILKAHHWEWSSLYGLAWISSVGKVAVISTLALFISLITTSTASSMTLTSFLWVMGHFSSELKFLGEKSNSALVKLMVSFFYQVTPDFAVYNYRDFFRSDAGIDPSYFLWLGFYTLSYAGTMLFLSAWLFSKREY